MASIRQFLIGIRVCKDPQVRVALEAMASARVLPPYEAICHQSDSD